MAEQLLDRAYVLASREQACDFPFGQYRGQTGWAFCAHHFVEPRQFPTKYLLVEEEQCVERLILSCPSASRSVASQLRKAETSAAPISAGWRLP